MSANLALLLDTQVLVWIGLDDRRLSAAFRKTLIVADVQYFVSAVVAFEFEDLRRRNRLDDVDNVDVIVRGLGATILDYPAEANRLLPLLPTLHRDPIDRIWSRTRFTLSVAQNGRRTPDRQLWSRWI